MPAPPSPIDESLDRAEHALASMFDALQGSPPTDLHAYVLAQGLTAIALMLNAHVHATDALTQATHEQSQLLAPLLDAFRRANTV
jgi:hypothetical protein